VCHLVQVLGVLGFNLPQYRSPTLLLSLGLSVRVLWHLIMTRPDVIHVSSPGLLVFAAILYAKLLDLPLVVSYHTHVPEYIPKYTWRGFVRPMWWVIRFCTWISDVTLVTSQVMKVRML
jgi:sulfoquinovosyltransferase